MDREGRSPVGRSGSPPAVLLVDADGASAEAIRQSLQREGLRVVVTPDGVRGIDAFRSDPPVLVLLDLALPGLSGLDVCRILRAESSVRIMIVTARAAESDKVAAFETGADDYLTKPFGMAELVSRVRAHLRRAGLGGGSADAEVISTGPVELDLGRHEARVRGARVDLTPKEFALLRTLMTAKGRLRVRDQLISEVWGRNYVGDTKTLDVHIKRLRHKIESDPYNPEHLITVRGLGYRLLEQPDPRACGRRGATVGRDLDGRAVGRRVAAAGG